MKHMNEAHTGHGPLIRRQRPLRQYVARLRNLSYQLPSNRHNERRRACEVCCSGTPHFYCSLLASFAGLPLTLALGHEGHHAECNETAVNALKADIQAMGEGEAKTTATEKKQHNR